MKVVGGLATLFNVLAVREALQLNRDKHELARVLDAIRTFRIHGRLRPVIERSLVLELVQPQTERAQRRGRTIQPDDG